MELLGLINQLDGLAFGFALVFITLDVVSGYAQAVANKCVSSEVMRRGFWHKLALVFAMLAAGLADMAAAAEINLGFSVPLFECACGYVMLMELMSILENVRKMNPDLENSKLMQLFDVVRDDKDD